MASNITDELNPEDFNIWLLGMFASMEDDMVFIMNHTSVESGETRPWFTILKHDDKYWTKMGNLSYMVSEVRMVSDARDTDWNSTFELFSKLESMADNQTLVVQREPQPPLMTVLFHNDLYWNLLANNVSELKGKIIF